MSAQASATSSRSTRVEWMWKSNSDPWSKTEEPKWQRYSDVENMIIEKAYSTGQTHAILDGYCVDFKHLVQISDSHKKKQRPVKRTDGKTDGQRVREERFMPDPIAPKRPFGGEYGWVSPFIKEVRKYLNLRIDQWPSKDENIVPMIVENAAHGIIEEGKLIGKRRVAETMANDLMAQQRRDIDKSEIDPDFDPRRHAAAFDRRRAAFDDYGFGARDLRGNFDRYGRFHGLGDDGRGDLIRRGFGDNDRH
ncbi:unnamed protein product [Rotaria sp. Silwood1]|nr:unnamed protein product [Rotaria sp. Silwood1]